MPMPTWLRSVLVAAAVGAAAGLVVGGAGGRLVMRLVALAQPPDALGTRMPSGAAVGDVTWAGTAQVLGWGALVGVIGGLLYLGVRAVLPAGARVRAPVFAGFLLLVPGAVFSADPAFARLERPLLALALFAPVFVLFGLAVPVAVERLAPGPAAGRGGLARTARGFLVLTVAVAVTVQVVSLSQVAAR
ncbi:hypothetical protein [Georgenia ruanii]|uniref:hypothetical protein n=1 Tax=Georgenia ruanii TaxID=348442 RepID=UPI00126428FC|nr:hypothetical protein [Georgenia ruanii]